MPKAIMKQRKTYFGLEIGTRYLLVRCFTR